AEMALHGMLLRDPRRPIAAAQIDGIADPDARENWQMMIAWRDYLARHGSLEAAYLSIVRRDVRFPRVMIGQLVQVILRNALDGCEDAFMLRAAEMFFRLQQLIPQESSVLAIDEETDSAYGRHSPTPLSALLGLPVTEIDLLDETSADSYWERSD